MQTARSRRTQSARNARPDRTSFAAPASCVMSEPHQKGFDMLEWTPISVNEKPLLRGKNILPEYSAALVGNSVVLRHYGGGLSSVSVALTTIPFPDVDAAARWIAQNRLEIQGAGGATAA